MVVKNYIPDRGDIIWLDFDPQSGHEQKGKRPALVLSPKDYNKKVGLGIFCPITSHIKKYPFEVEIKNAKISGAILSDQIRSLDWIKRNASFIIKAPEEKTEEVAQKATILIHGK